METQPDMNLVIAANLKALRAAKQLSLGEAAERTGVSKSMLGQIERGESSPTISTLWKIATGLQVSFTSLMEQPEPQTQLIREADMQPLTGDEGRFLLYPVIQSCAGRPFEILDLVWRRGRFRPASPMQTARRSLCWCMRVCWKFGWAPHRQAAWCIRAKYCITMPTSATPTITPAARQPARPW